jgi:hypothetical protein
VWLAGDFNFCATHIEEQQHLNTSYTDLWQNLQRDELGATMGINHPVPFYKPARFDRVLYPTLSCTVTNYKDSRALNGLAR